MTERGDAGTDPPAVRPARVRPARAHDAAALAALRRAALAEQALLRGGELYAQREARPTPSPGTEGTALWVGELAGEVVGYLAARADGLRDGRLVGVIEAVYVDPACRGVGVGEAMLGPALDWFRAQACVGVDALALPGARATKNFFEESGFTSRLLVMHHRLEDGPKT
jgi:GNAT superfamily N-acetyltransferase